MSANEKLPKNKITKTSDGTAVFGYEPSEKKPAAHRYLATSEAAVRNGMKSAAAALRLHRSGYRPDIIVAHSGWGSGSFLKTIWPDAKFVQYLEWWYTHPPRDVDQSASGASKQHFDQMASTMCRNLPFLLDFEDADAVLVPTEFQALDVPGFVRKKLTVMHDGVDCEFFSPAPHIDMKVNGELTLTPDHQVITYATRGMEPMRGFPSFMEALWKVQQTHKHVHAVIAGGDTVHYADWPAKGDSFRRRSLDTWDLDLERVHFVGKLPLPKYRNVLRRSDVHVYLSRPFVLSWSLIEAMATGCPLVVSDNEPLREALPNGHMASHVNHLDTDALADAIRWMLDNPDKARKRGTVARNRALSEYSCERLHPAHRDFFLNLINGSTG